MKNTQIFSLPPFNHLNCSSESVLEYFINTWNLSETMYNSIENREAFFQNPDPFRLPLIFYLGHSAVFYINKLLIAGVINNRINCDYEKLFAEGVDPSSSNKLKKDFLWPTYNQVVEYRKKVFECIIEVIKSNDFRYVSPETPEWALLMAIDHDRIHFETSSVLIRQYPVEVLKKPVEWHYAPIATSVINQPTMLFVPKGIVTMGKPQGHPNFGWDNEYGYNSIEVESFYASRNLISNKEFTEFVEDKGYDKQNFWSEEGWKWKIENDIKHPKFWVQIDGGYKYRAMFDQINMPLDWPVEVNFYEAMAYCNWVGKGTRLITEPEFELLAQHNKINPESCVNESFNINLKFGSPCSVNYFNNEEGLELFNDIYGNVFQWLNTPFYPLPGFQTHYLYPNFSYPYFGKNHVMLKGGSWASTGASASKYYRLWFRPYMYQHAGFRIAKSTI